MDTAVQMYRRDQKLVACALGEPSMTLIENGSAFGLLVALSAHADSYSARFLLDTVLYLHIRGPEIVWSCHGTVAIDSEDGVWVAREESSGLLFPNPSIRPYCVVFITKAQYKGFQYSRAEGLGYPPFKLAQRLFGSLPGFAFVPKADSLSSPATYATAYGSFPPWRYMQGERRD